MKTRREFLVDFFARVESNGLPYVVARNYGEVFDSATSDVDLITPPESLGAMIACIRKSAEINGFSIVQCVQLTSLSLGLWDGECGYLRIDFDIALRWRAFALMSASEIVGRRRFVDGIATPSPEDEIIGLLTKVLWMSQLTPRYAEQMQGLLNEIEDRSMLEQLCRRVFGISSSLLSKPDSQQLRDALEEGVKKVVFRDPKRLWRTALNRLDDVKRLAARLFNPPGVLLQIYSDHEVNAHAIIEAHSVLFPVLKSKVFKGPSGRVGFRSIFRGGLAIECYPASSGANALKAARQSVGRWLFWRRRFALVSISGHPSFLLHPQTGTMQTIRETLLGTLDGAMGRALAKEWALPRPSHGVFAVLVGLDGSGKTTLARNLSSASLGEDRFAGMRYLHWIPRPGAKPEYPLPALSETPRKGPLRPTLLNATLSGIRLCLSVLKANIGYRLYCKPALRKGYIVVLDRYFLNYWIDPESVRYVGPERLLSIANRLFPAPDCLIVLNADEQTLLARKRELTPEQISDQRGKLSRLPSCFNRLDFDSSFPPDLLALQVLEAIKKFSKRA